MEQTKVYHSDKNGYHLGAAEPLSKDTLEKIAYNIQQSSKNALPIKCSKILNGELLYFNFNPIGFKIGFFDQPTKRTFRIDKKTYTIKVPMTIYLCSGSRITVFFAVSKTGTVDLNTLLYEIPLPNISAGGVCNGSAKLHIRNKADIHSIMQGYRDLMWLPKFTGTVKQLNDVLINDSVDISKLKPYGKLSKILKLQANDSEEEDYEDEEEEELIDE